MGTTFYSTTETGGIRFSTTRKIGDVRIPNYVYDMWMPLLGAEAIGVYATYCRLERNGGVRAITLTDIANACRVSKTTLYKINEKLVRCGFVSIASPEGKNRLMHWTCEIVTNDPPQEINQTLLDEYAPKRGYQLLTPWLEEMADREDFEPETKPVPPEVPGSTSGSTTQYPDEVLPGTPKIAALDQDLAALEGCNTAPAGAEPSPSERRLKGLRDRLGSDPFSVAQTCLSAQEQAGGVWTIPAEAGGADPVGEEMLQAWLESKAVDPQLVPDPVKERFRRTLGKLAREMPGITPAQAAQAVRTILDKNNPEFGYYTYSDPAVKKFGQDWKEIAMRLLSDPEGGGQSPASQTATDGFLRLLEKERAKQAAFPTYQRPAGTSQPAPSQPAPEPHEVAVAAETVTSAIPTPTLRKKPKQWYELLVLPGQEQPTKEAQSNG